MTEIIEPNPLLLDYISEARALFTDFDGAKKEFVDAEEWHYVPSELEQNIYLLKRLDERGLLDESNSVFDCGVGLATTMFDLYLQSKEIEGKEFTFGGVEKHERYVEYYTDRLMHFWEGNLNLIVGEIMDQDYSKHNIVYTYSPFKTVAKLTEFYEKITSEISSGSIIVESRNMGRGHMNTLMTIDGLEEIEVDDIYVYRKK